MKDHHMSTSPDSVALPSTKSLLKATGGAVAAAAVILVLFVLPAEYNVDPTGLGSRMGLTELTKPAVTPTTTDISPAASPTSVTVAKRPTPFHHDTLTLTLQPDSGSEIKADMKKGETMVFSWTSDSGPLNVDMHGEPPNAGNDFTSYWKEKSMTSGHGVFIAPFDGEHGWYWGNRGSQPVTVTVVTSGYYRSIAPK